MKGCAYYNIKYPGFISLPDGFNCIFKIDERYVCILIRKKIQAMQITDFNNGINKEIISPTISKHTLKNKIESIDQHTITVEYNLTEYFIYELNQHYNRIFQSDYYTDIHINFDSNGNDESEFAYKALKYFIREYRIATANYWVLEPDDMIFGNNVCMTGFHNYTETEQKMNYEQRLCTSRNITLTINKFNILGSKFNNNFSEQQINICAAILTKRISDGIKYTFFDESILRATQEINIFRNYKYGFLELFFTIESFLVEFLTNEKVKVGISNNKIKEYKSEVGISYLINIELPLVIKEISTEDKEIIIRVDNMRKKRNDLVHNNGNISETEAKDALKTTISFIELLKTKAKG